MYTNQKILKPALTRGRFSNRETELNSQFSAAGGTATRDDQATFVTSHADTETMGIAALGFFGLICAF